MIQDFMLKILICFNSPISEHLTPMHRTPHVFPIPLWNWAIFVALESLSGGLQMFYELQKYKNNLWGFNFSWIFKCSLTSLFTLVTKIQGSLG